jgi:sulfur carrier protein
MNLWINGEKVDVPKPVETVTNLLAYYSLQEKIVIVELNHEILEKSAHAQTRLSDGDRIEIVHFVGGG